MRLDMRLVAEMSVRSLQARNACSQLINDFQS